MLDITGVIQTCQALTGTRRRVVLICPDWHSAGYAQMRWAAELLRSRGAVPVGQGTGMWNLDGHIFRFVSARQDLRLLQESMRGSIVLLLCQPSDFGEDIERFRDILQALFDRGEAYVVVPSRPSDPTTRPLAR